MTAAIFGLIGVLLGAILTFGKDWHLQKSLRDRKARYLAVRVVCILDQFAMDCIDVSHDDGLNMGSMDYENGRQMQAKEPNAIILPGDVDWESIEIELSYKVLCLPVRLSFIKKMILNTSESDSPPWDDTFEERQYQYACLGLSALEIAKTIRNDFKISENDHSEIKIQESLKETKEKIENKRKRHGIIQS